MRGGAPLPVLFVCVLQTGLARDSLIRREPRATSLTTELPRENGSAPEPARSSNGENSTKAAAIAANAKESVGIRARWVALIVHRLFDLVRNDAQFNFSTSKPGMLSALLLLGGVVVVLFVAIRFPDKLLGGPEASPVRRRVEQVRLTSGAEIESMYGLRSQGAQRPAQPMSPGLLMRLRGRVVLMAASGEEPQPKALLAPLSLKPCVMYSASVSEQSDNGVHRPPLAFHASRIGQFAIELPDAPHIHVGVHAHDVDLFDMTDGRHGSECAFSEAPDAWSNFMISHPTFCGSALTNAKEGLGLGVDGQLQFRECSLHVNATVTVVGEMTRDRDGMMWLHPWRAATDRSYSSGPRLTSVLLPLLRLPVKGISLSARDPAAGKVLVSDDVSLFSDYWAAAPTVV